MAYVPSFEHDVFVSYAHQDNLDGRVTAFHADLVKALQTNLGNRAYSQPEKWIFFDQRGLDYGDRVTGGSRGHWPSGTNTPAKRPPISAPAPTSPYPPDYRR